MTWSRRSRNRMQIDGIRLLLKDGGKSGRYEAKLMISVEEAQARVLALAAPARPPKTCRWRKPPGAGCAAPVAARADQPPFDASAMDGYARARRPRRRRPLYRDRRGRRRPRLCRQHRPRPGRPHLHRRAGARRGRPRRHPGRRHPRRRHDHRAAHPGPTGRQHPPARARISRPATRLSPAPPAPHRPGPAGRDEHRTGPAARAAPSSR